MSFTVGRGEVAALLGPNGSGKSTLLRCLIGYFPPTAGRVRVGGIDVDQRSVAARREVGYLPEQVSLYPELTPRRYLRFVAGMKGLDGSTGRTAAEEALDRCALRGVADQPSGTLSKGYRQRVGMAQALLGDPAVLVLDEPTVGLDPVQVVEMRDLLRSLEHRTVLLSTHILSEAAALCSRVVILSRGRLVAEDTAAGLAARAAGTGRVIVRIEGPADEAVSALAELPGVHSAAIEPDGQGGVRIVLRTRSPVPVQRAVGGAVLERGWTLVELRAESPTLEDLFVRAVR